MISYTHDDAWRADLNSCVETTANCLNAFGLGETKDIPTVIADEMQDRGSDFFRFVEIIFDEARFDAELSFAAETKGNKTLAYHDHARNKEIREANGRRFNSLLNDALLFCGMSKDYGMEFKDSILGILNDSFPHLGFLFELYETIMLKTRWRLLEDKETA